MSDARKLYMAQVDAEINKGIQLHGIGVPDVGTKSPTNAIRLQALQSGGIEHMPTKLGEPTAGFNDLYATQPQPGSAGYSNLAVYNKPTLPLAFQKASNLRLQRNEIKAPAPPKESYDRYQQRIAQSQRSAFLRQSKARYNYEQALENARQATKNVFSGVFNQGTQALDKIPTPGNLKVPVLILLILWLALVSVNGHTRLGWLWLTFIGKAKIQLTNATNAQINQAITQVGQSIFPQGGGQQQNTIYNFEQPDTNTIPQGFDYANLYGDV